MMSDSLQIEEPYKPTEELSIAPLSDLIIHEDDHENESNAGDYLTKEIEVILQLDGDSRSKTQLATLSRYLLKYQFFQKVAEKHTTETQNYFYRSM